MNYSVPSFGAHDIDIGSSLANMKAQEKSFDNKDWLPGPPSDHPRDYPVPSFGMDKDV